MEYKVKSFSVKIGSNDGADSVASQVSNFISQESGGVGNL